MNNTSRFNRYNTAIKQEGKRHLHGPRKTTNAMELADLEEKARLFYKLAVVKDRKYRFRTYRSTFVGKEMVDSMVVSGLAESRQQAVELGSAIAENFDLFENCENNFLNRTAYFEDEPNRFYRFSSGILMLIQKMNEREVNDDKVSAFTSFKSAASNHNRPRQGPGLQRQNGTRRIKSYRIGVENDVEYENVFHDKKRLDKGKKFTAPVSLASMHAIIEEDGSRMASSRGSTTNAANVEVGCVEGREAIQRPVKEHFEPECEEEEKVATLPTRNKGIKSVRRLEDEERARNATPHNQQILDGANNSAEKIDSKSITQSLHQEEHEEQDLLPFVRSPKDLPASLRRGTSENTESFDNFEFILNKKEGNLLTMGSDDDRSMWTEYIIGDREGREQYRQNEVKRRRPSYVSCVEKTIIDDVENDCNKLTPVKTGAVFNKDTVSNDKMLISNLQPSDEPASISKNVDDDQSYMGYTVFDNTIAMSYVDDDEESVLSEPPPEEDEKTLFHIFANPPSGSGDDDMTQITMDHALMHKPEKNLRGVSIYPSASIDTSGSEKSYLTPKNRIQNILWNDLYSRDFSVVRLAMEELRTIVASEPESRKRIVRMGGVMAIMGTMDKHIELEAIQYYGCVIIELLASMEPDARKAFYEMKGIQLIVRSMQDQTDSDRVQEAGRAALVTVCRLHQPGLF